jgi:hypothetical protein
MSASVLDSYSFGKLKFQLLTATSSCAQHPTVSINVAKGWLILGGGAFVDWDGPCAISPNPMGNLLTAMYPDKDGSTWTVASKDHIQLSPASIVAYVIVAQMCDGTPINGNDYIIVENTSAAAAHPTLQVDLPEEFTLVGGGARANYTGVGSMLYGSYPVNGKESWIGSAKDHLISDTSSTITVWAIGLKTSFLDEAEMNITRVTQTTPTVAHHPRIALVVPDFHLTGGGALVNWSGLGSLLTAAFPQDRQTWRGEGKSHLRVDPSTITVWAIGFK